MEWLNYHHLHYFWLVAREGGVARAAEKLRLSHPTVSAQIHALEDALGEPLFEKQGRRLVLTEMGRLVYDYADEIFSLGRELLDTVRGRPTGRPLRLQVGLAQGVPKLIAKRLLEPAFALPQSLALVCKEAPTDDLVAALSAHTLDVLLSDAPLRPGSAGKAFNHLLGECGVTIFGTADLAARYRAGFPRSLHGAPLLLSTHETAARRALEQYLDGAGLRPLVAAEFDDSALLKVFGQDGVGLFAAPTAIEAEVSRQYEVEVVGRLPEVRERFYALTMERRIRHPAVAALCDSARTRLFAAPGPGDAAGSATRA